MSSPDLSLALAGFAIGMLGIIWAEEIQILELRVQRWQPSWVRIPGYETLLLEVLQGDQTLFVHADETEAAWRLYTPLLRKRSPSHFYPAGSWGPAAADRLIRIPGNAWVNR